MNIRSCASLLDCVHNLCRSSWTARLYSLIPASFGDGTIVHHMSVASVPFSGSGIGGGADKSLDHLEVDRVLVQGAYSSGSTPLEVRQAHQGDHPARGPRGSRRFIVGSLDCGFVALRGVCLKGNHAMPRLRRISARRSPVHGTGLFALPVEPGERLIEYKREITSWRRSAARQRSDAGHPFVFGLSDGRISDGSRGGNSALSESRGRPQCEAIETAIGYSSMRSLRSSPARSCLSTTA